MPLYLMRHGEAAQGNDDALRPLTVSGCAAVQDVAQQAADQNAQMDRIFHSGLVRAEQTAQLLAEPLGFQGEISRRAGLQPEDDPEPIARWLFDETMAHPDTGLALVGHLPFMERLAARLLAGPSIPPPVRFTPATLVKLSRSSDGRRFELEWTLTPRM
jgi:phosphohistidine phosphatase